MYDQIKITFYAKERQQKLNLIENYNTDKDFSSNLEATCAEAQRRFGAIKLIEAFGFNFKGDN